MRGKSSSAGMRGKGSRRRPCRGKSAEGSSATATDVNTAAATATNVNATTARRSAAAGTLCVGRQRHGDNRQRQRDRQFSCQFPHDSSSTAPGCAGDPSTAEVGQGFKCPMVFRAVVIAQECFAMLQSAICDTRKCAVQHSDASNLINARPPPTLRWFAMS
jgi:hypothetical protein